MHPEILNKQQRQLVPLLRQFKKDFGLVGGTAIALHIGHRRSIDFDLFSTKPLRTVKLQRQIKKMFRIEQVIVDEKDEFTVIVVGVKITFLHYPFPLTFTDAFQRIPMADLLTLAALKAYALGRRGKWKDYIDLYFILRQHLSLMEICQQAVTIFDVNFSEKNFRSQLSYFKDIDYSEQVEFMPRQRVGDTVIKRFLTHLSRG